MRYYLDTEFNSFGGALISLALVRNDGESIYLMETLERIRGMKLLDGRDPWIEQNILPISTTSRKKSKLISFLSPNGARLSVTSSTEMVRSLRSSPTGRATSWTSASCS